MPRDPQIVVISPEKIRAYLSAGMISRNLSFALRYASIVVVVDFRRYSAAEKVQLGRVKKKCLLILDRANCAINVMIEILDSTFEIFIYFVYYIYLGNGQENEKFTHFYS